jgi:hypothetical protein
VKAGVFPWAKADRGTSAAPTTAKATRAKANPPMRARVAAADLPKESDMIGNLSPWLATEKQ